MAKTLRFSLVLLHASLSCGVTLMAQDTGADSADDEIATAPIQLDGTVLLMVRGVSSLPA